MSKEIGKTNNIGLNAAGRFLSIILSIVCGGVLGVLSKAADVAVTGSFAGTLFWNFGLVTSSLLLWCMVGYFIASYISPMKLAMLCNGCFFLSMLLTYYLYSHYVVGYLNRKIVVFWVFMTFASVVLTAVIQKFTGGKPFRIICNVFVAGVFAFDVFIMQGFELPALIMETLLLVVTLLMINRKHQKR